MIDYRPDGDRLVWVRPLEADLRLSMSAAEVRKERTGVHARVDIAMNGRSLAWGVLNVDKDEDRVRMSNSAWGQVNGHAGTFDKPEMKRCIDAFCKGLWEASLGNLASTLMAGAEAEPPEYVLDPYIIEEGGTILFAKPGRGKSFLTLLMAVSIDAGDAIPVERQLWPVRQQPVLFINLERGARGMARRLGRINSVLGLSFDRPLRTMNQRGKSLADIYEAARREVREHGIGHVCLDSISRAGAGDLNDNQPANRIIDLLNGLAPSWTGIAHAPRASDEHIFGGIHFDAGADIVVRITAEEKGEQLLGVGLQITKANDVPKPEMEVRALEFASYGLKAVRTSNTAEFPGLESTGLGNLREMVYEHVRALGVGTSATEVARELGVDRTRVTKEFADATRYKRFGRRGSSVLFGAIAPKT